MCKELVLRLAFIIFWNTLCEFSMKKLSSGLAWLGFFIGICFPFASASKFLIIPHIIESWCFLKYHSSLLSYSHSQLQCRLRKFEQVCCMVVGFHSEFITETAHRLIKIFTIHNLGVGTVDIITFSPLNVNRTFRGEEGVRQWTFSAGHFWTKANWYIFINFTSCVGKMLVTLFKRKQDQL